MKTKVLFVGAGGVAREVTSWAHDMVEIVGYATLDFELHVKFGLPGLAYDDDVTPASVGTDVAVMTNGTPATKVMLYNKLTAKGFRFQSLVHPSSVVANNVTIGEGVIICPQVNVSPDVVLGKLCCLNFCVGVGHDTIIGNFSQVNPGSQIGGSSRIGVSVLVGSGSTVREGVVVGDNATIGSGAVVLGRVAAGATMIGNPARRWRAFEH